MSAPKTKKRRIAEDAPASKPSQKPEPGSSEDESEEEVGSEAEAEVPQDGAANNESKPAKSFEDLGMIESLVDACKAIGYKNPTPIQQESIPLALQGRDIIGLAETGSGKTAAFALPILQGMSFLGTLVLLRGFANGSLSTYGEASSPLWSRACAYS